ncbi:MAG: DNA mismatch repair endonuclease MutL [Caldilineaceae bacterium SB0668_bin_21]|nr:DNA mismatch repair endonuclease MutL [Caldilineaceae bacterium SB0668_bin_21]MYC22783.1 DNA mismatch repair endonuclease MutL [Caldilineaceae bacterium SB0662_bin_25]
MAIQLLSQDVAAKIAAGEVVERPANVAKELIENSLDAGATEVQVEIREGGRRLLQVTDDGHGIPAAELPLAAQRHATSKLDSAADLDRITSFGFRGEALYSIAAVSQMTLKSRRSGDESGAELRIEGGKVTRDQPAGLPVGTVVTVENIFFNTPARRKFLRRPATEAGNIAAIVQRYALAYPDCRFKFVSDGKLSFFTEGAGRTDEVLAKIYGRENAQLMIGVGRSRPESGARHAGAAVSDEADTLSQPERQPQEDEINFMPDAAGGPAPASPPVVGHTLPRQTGRATSAHSGAVLVSGYVSSLTLTRPTRAQINLFINRRYVEDRSLTHAVVQAYHTLLPVGRFPMAVLFVDLDPSEVDVNVHPRKTEVRFVDPNKVFSAVQRTVRRAVIDSAGVPTVGLGEESVRPAESHASWHSADSAPQEQVHLQQTGWSARRHAILNAGVGRQPEMPFEPPSVDHPAVDPPLDAPNTPPADSPPQTAAGPDTSPHPDEQALPPLRVVGQAGATYVVAEGPEGLYLIDQHAAHERILYEKFMAQRQNRGTAGGLARQGLLTPITLHVGDSRAGLVAQHLHALNAIGFDAEHFGGDTFLVRSVPGILSNQDSERALDEIVQGLAESRDLVGEELEARLVKMVCKRASIKAGQILSDIEMKELVRQLERCRAPRTCPHGRPTMLKLSAGELERAFKRT